MIIVNYCVSIILICLGLYAVTMKKDLIKVVIGLGIILRTVALVRGYHRWAAGFPHTLEHLFVKRRDAAAHIHHHDA